MTVSPAFATALAAGRADFNRRTVEARRHHQGFDQEAFAAFLAGQVDALVAAVAQRDPGRTGDVASAAYDIALELAGLGLIGARARSQVLSDAWRELMPACADLVARDPAAVLGLLSNAVLHLETVGSARRTQWIGEMAALAPRLESTGQLRAAGQVLAWRAGVAHFRKSALAAADGLPEVLALAAYRAPEAGSWSALRTRIENDPCWRATVDGPAQPAYEVGAFAGFGGAFATPPEVRSGGDHFLVRSGGRHFLLLADAYGSSLPGASALEFDEAAAMSQAPRFLIEGGRLTVGHQQIALDLPADGLALCATAATLAITSPYTHAIVLVPRR